MKVNPDYHIIIINFKIGVEPPGQKDRMAYGAVEDEEGLHSSVRPQDDEDAEYGIL